MKVVVQIIGLFLLATTTLASSSEVVPDVEEPQQRNVRPLSMDPFNTRRSNMNEYMDYVMLGVAEWMREGGVTPMDLPDLMEGFSYKPLLIEYSGWCDLHNGKLLDIARVYRAGDCFMSYDRLLLRIEAVAALSEMSFTYDYSTTIMGLGIFDGYVEGYAENIVVKCEFLIDMYDFYIFMQDFEVTSIGGIDVRLRGNLLTDWIGNIMIDIITTLFKNTVTGMVSERVKGFVQVALDEINNNRFTANAKVLQELLRSALSKQGIVLPMDLLANIAVPEPKIMLA